MAGAAVGSRAASARAARPVQAMSPTQQPSSFLEHILSGAGAAVTAEARRIETKVVNFILMRAKCWVWLVRCFAC